MTAFAGYLALGNIDGSTGAFVEITGGAYARQAVSLAPDGAGTLKNAVDVNFPTPTGADWPSVSAYAVFAAVTGGNPLLYWGISSAATEVARVGRKGRTVSAGRIALDFPVAAARSSHGTDVIVAPSIAVTRQGLLTPAAVLAALNTDSGLVPLTANYTLQASDNGATFTVGAAITVTVPPTLPAGFNAGFEQPDALVATFAMGAGATKRGSGSTTAQYAYTACRVIRNTGGSAAEVVISGGA